MMQSIAIVVPCYNEFNRLPVEEFETYLALAPEAYFLFVNDGSTDATINLLNDFQQKYPSNIEVLDLQQNGGKAEAVRQGILHLTKNQNIQYIGYFDADLATPLDEIIRFHKALAENPHVEVLAGSRIKRMGVNIQRSEVRHYFGRVFATCASWILQLPIYDTQCGAKMISSTLAKDIFQEKFMSPWLFDVEMFARVILNRGHQNACKTIFEIPLNTWVEKGDSRIKMSYLFKMPLELFKIYRKYHKKIVKTIAA